MGVYVDKARHNYGRMKMCHMIADTEEELHTMADRIGVDRKHFQAEGTFKHYDVCLTKRNKAIKCGAYEVTSRELVRLAYSSNWITRKL